LIQYVDDFSAGQDVVDDKMAISIEWASEEESPSLEDGLPISARWLKLWPIQVRVEFENAEHATGSKTLLWELN